MTLDELKAQKIWFLGNYAPGKNDKKTKAQMSSNGSVTGTSDNFRNTWDDYDTTIRSKEKFSATGIRFKLPDNMYFLDIDGRPLDDSFVQPLLERYDTYVETSPSGNGIHIFGICYALNGIHFLDFVKRYTEVPKLTSEIIREFVEKVYVYHPEKIKGQKTQRVRIIWNCIGEISTQNKTA